MIIIGKEKPTVLVVTSYLLLLYSNLSYLKILVREKYSLLDERAGVWSNATDTHTTVYGDVDSGPPPREEPRIGVKIN